MAAYAALASVMHIIDQVQHHPRPPISLDKEQFESLTKNLTFLQEFLEGYSHVIGYSREADGFEIRIADAAYAAEDIIESHIVDQILARSTTHGEKISSNIDFYECLQKVIHDIDKIKKEVMEIKDKMGLQHQLHKNSSISSASLRSSSTVQNISMVGFDDILLEIMDKLTGGKLALQIIPIVGMGGIGKTTLARNIFMKRLVKEHFDICAWVTISQEYNTREILREVLSQGNKEGMGDLGENELGEMLHKHLSGRRYLIVMDDLWDVEAWDEVRWFFPDNGNGSRIVITARISNLAFQLTASYGLKMRFLDEDESWNLFSKIVFEEEGCPLELEEIGKKIVENCKGLPLSIVVIGGLLARSAHAQEYWQYIAENLNSVVNLDDNERCLKILHMSYNQLPAHLKPCFLYMGFFSEDNVIGVSKLIKLWVAEGFLNPIGGKSLEVVAKEYLEELIDRNLVLVYKLGSIGRIKCCNMHDLVRDLCLREAQKERFYNVRMQRSLNLPQGMSTQRRIVIPESTSMLKALDALQSMSLARSLIWEISGVLPILLNFRLLRILEALNGGFHGEDRYFLEFIFHLVNSRYLAITAHPRSRFPSSVYLLWNLQTLIVSGVQGITAPTEIWNMSQLRHVEFEALYLPNPPIGDVDGQDDIVLGNLQTLMTIVGFKCGQEVVKRIPNVKKLKVSYYYHELEGGSPVDYSLNNLGCLHKLESFVCSSFLSPHFLQKLTFPHSLKKLTLKSNNVYWEDMLEKIGSLPCLEKLKLLGGSFKGREWETVEGQFQSLKFLQMYACGDFEYWTTESSHFPRLEHLALRELHDLVEIPSCIGEIPTLQSIMLLYCSDSAIISAKEMLEEQEELGEVGFQVRVTLRGKNEELKSLASPNFQFGNWY